MKYVSFDSETTDLKPESGLLLEFAAVVEDTEHPEIPVEKLPGSHRGESGFGSTGLRSEPTGSGVTS